MLRIKELSRVEWELNAWRDSITRFFASDFFHESSSPKPLKIILGSFQMFSKISRDIRNSGKLPLLLMTPAANLPPVSTIPEANFATSSCGVVDTGGKLSLLRISLIIFEKFAAGVTDTKGKFCHQFRWCCWYRWQICHWCQRYQRQICHWCH